MLVLDSGYIKSIWNGGGQNREQRTLRSIIFKSGLKRTWGIMSISYLNIAHEI